MRAIPMAIVAAAAVLLAACSSFGIKEPLDGATVPPGTVNFRVEAGGGAISNFRATLDSADRTSDFTVSGSVATASIAVTTIGSHTFSATADVYDSLYRRDIARSGAVTFTTPGPPAPSFTLNAPSSAQGERGDAVSVNVTIARANGFAGPVQLTASGPALDANAGATIAAAATTATLTLNIKDGASIGASSVTVNATGAGAQAQNDTISLRVVRQQGGFSDAAFAVTTPPQSGSGGPFTVAARVGQPSLPSAFAAEFSRAGAPIGNLIGYNHGATNVQGQAYGGAGFCDASNAGFVIAGVGPGVVSARQYAIFFIDLQTGTQSQQVDTGSFRSAYYYQPRVWFSPDCTVAIAVGADPTGPVNNLGQVVDVVRGTIVGSFQFDAPTFTATVTAPNSNGAQRVQISADGSTQTVNLP